MFGSRRDEISERIRRARAKRDAAWQLPGGATTGWRDKAEQAIAYWLGFQQQDWRAPDRARVTIKNAIRPNAEIMIAAMTSERYRYVGEGRGSTANDDLARVAAEVASYEEAEMNVAAQDEPLCRDLYIFGYGCGLAAWAWGDPGTDAEVARVLSDYGLGAGELVHTREGTVEHHAYPQAMGDGLMAQAPGPDGMPGGSPVTEIVNADWRVKRAAAKSDPVWEHLPSTDVWFDPLERNLNALSHSRFVCWREWKTEDELKRDGRNKLRGVSFSARARDDYFEWFQPTSDGEPVVEVVYYCGEDPENPDRTVLSVRVNDGNDEIRRSEWLYGYLPVMVIADVPAPGQLYPDSRVFQCIQHQDRLNRAETDLEIHRGRADRVAFTRQGVFDEKAQRAYRRGEPLELIQLQMAKNDDIRSAVYFPEIPQIQIDLYNAREQAKQDIREILSVTDYMAGQFPDRRRQATEVNALMSSSGVRGKSVGERWRAFRVTRALRVLHIIRDNLPPDVSRRYMWMDDEGQRQWARYTQQTLSGEYAIRIEVVQDSFSSPFEQADKWLALLRELAPFMAQVNPATGGPWVNLNPILMKIAYAWGLERPQEIIPQAPIVPPAAAPAPPGAEPGMGAEMAGAGGVDPAMLQMIMGGLGQA